MHCAILFLLLVTDVTIICPTSDDKFYYGCSTTNVNLRDAIKMSYNKHPLYSLFFHYSMFVLIIIISSSDCPLKYFMTTTRMSQKVLDLSTNLEFPRNVGVNKKSMTSCELHLAVCGLSQSPHSHS